MVLSSGDSPPAAHTRAGSLPCYEPYYSFGTLAQRVATILLTSPAAPPVSLPDEMLRPDWSAVAIAEDSLQMAPLIADSIPAGQIVNKTVAIPATSLAILTLVSTDAHLSLVDPGGTPITVADTSMTSGISYFVSSDLGLEGFEIAGPMPGTWTMRINTTASSAGQKVAGIVEYPSASSVALSVDPSLLYPGDAMHVRGLIASSGILRTDVTWNCNVLGPGGTSTELTLYDDGAHGDSLAGDGIYGNVTAPPGGVGLYALSASATAPGVGPLATVAYCEVADIQDLAVHPGDIRLSETVPQAGDSITVYATVHNISTSAAMGVTVEIRDLRADTMLGTSAVDFAAGSAVTVQAPWVPAAPDSHEIQVRVSPYVLDENDYSNNTASRVIVLGSPVGVDPGGVPPRLRFDPPCPNPTSHAVVFSFSVPRQATGSLFIFDVLGRRVQSWSWAELSPGGHSLEWDGRGSSGQRLPTGVYLCCLGVGREQLQRRIVLRR